MAVPFMYSIFSAAECESPKPALTLMCDSTLMGLHSDHELVLAQIIGLHRAPGIAKV
jgi:hypothetical protein